MEADGTTTPPPASGRKVIIAPDGGDTWAPAKPRRDETVIGEVRAHRWKWTVENRISRSATQSS